MSFSIFPKDDKRQALRLRRTLMAMGAGVIHIILSFFLFHLNLFWITGEQFYLLLGFFTAGHLSIILAIRTGFNKRFRDPSLTLFQMYWALFCIMVTVFFLKEQRALILYFYFLAMVFGSFRMGRTQFTLCAVIAVASYILTITALWAVHPEYVDIGKETAGATAFGLVMFGFSLLGSEISALRETLNRRKNDLTKALSRIEEIAVIDELTGLSNRRQIMGILTEQQSLVNRGIYLYSVCFMDLDHFKEINDTHGHLIGDTVLKKFALAANGQIRTGDHVGRIGGEEFIVIAAGANREAATTLAERIRRITESIDFSDGAGDLRITVSVGVTMSRVGETIDDMLTRADKALYTAKQNGRNRVETI